MVRPDPSLVNYIEKHIEKGFNIKSIKQKLAEAGHPIEAIEAAASHVISSSKKSKRKVSAFTIVYGLILILVISAFIWFVWFKATQQAEFKEVLEETEKKRSLAGMTDVELLKLAASGDATACSFIRNHLMYYACIDSYWNREDCVFEEFIGVDRETCLYDHAGKSNNSTLCLRIEGPKSDECLFNVANKNSDYSFCSGSEVCLTNFASDHKNAEACRAIDNSEKEKDCFDRLANSSKEMSLCKEGSEFCMLSFLESKQEIIDYVKEEFPKHETGFSIIDLALNTRIIELCDFINGTVILPEIGEVSRSSACKVKVSYLNNDSSICSRLDIQKERNICNDVFTKHILATDGILLVTKDIVG